VHTSVAAAWPAFCASYEGRCTWLYLDTKRLPTTGLGHRVFTVGDMVALPWLTKDGKPATDTQKRAEWAAIGKRTDLAPKGGFAYQSVATLHLSDATVDGLLTSDTPAYWNPLVKVLPQLESWPADAQLALLDMAYNLGAYFLGSSWPNFTAACKAGDFTKAAIYCLRAVKAPRDYRHQRMFTNAATVVMLGADPETLWLDRTPSLPVPPVTPDPPTPTPEPLMHSSKWNSDYVSFRGGYVPPVVRDILLGIPSPVQLSQGGLSTSVSASANTHAGLGAYDIRVSGWSKAAILKICSELISCGECAFPRGPRWGSPSFAEHVHVCSNNAYASLHPEAQAQVRDFKHNPRRNGLVGHGAYVGPSTPLGKWSDSPWNPVNIAKKELELPTTNEVVTAVIKAMKTDKDLQNVFADALLNRDAVPNAGALTGNVGNEFVALKNALTQLGKKNNDIAAKVDALSAAVAAAFPGEPTPPAA
jgi:hypothetical protein